MPAQKYLFEGQYDDQCSICLKGNMMTNAASEVRNKYLKMRLKI